jgi:hypothetical protein
VRVRKQRLDSGKVLVELLDGAGEPVEVVSGFLRSLAARDYSLNTAALPQGAGAGRVGGNQRHGARAGPPARSIWGHFIGTLHSRHCLPDQAAILSSQGTLVRK